MYNEFENIDLSQHDNCPCCQQILKKNKRTLNKTLVLFLYEMCEMFFNEKPEQGIHYDLIKDILKKNHNLNASDYSVLKDFGLITNKDLNSGYWKPTKQAYWFLSNRLQVSKSFMELYNGNFFSDEKVYASDIIEQPFEPSFFKKVK